MTPALRRILLAPRTSAAAVVVGTAVDVVFFIATGTPGTMASESILQSGTLGAAPGTWTNQRGIAITHTTIESASVTRRVPLLCNGSVISGAIPRCIRFALTGVDHTNWEGFKNTFAAAHSDVTYRMLAKYNIATDVGDPDDTVIDTAVIESTSSYAVGELIIPNPSATGTQGSLVAHTNDGKSSSTGNAAIPANTVVEIHVRHNKTSQKAEAMLVDHATGVLIGCAQKLTTTPALGDALDILLEDYLVFFGGSFEVYEGALDWTNAAYPLGPVTVPAPTSVAASQTAASEATVSWSAVTQLYKIERSTNGGSFSTIQAAYDGGSAAGTKSYVDSSVLDGNSYSYRITAIAGSAQSSAATGSAASIDNSTFPAALDNFDSYGSDTVLDDAANWITQTGLFYVKKTSGDGAIWVSGTGTSYWSGRSWAANHRSEVTIDAIVSLDFQYMGPAVRIQSGANSHYELIAQGNHIYLQGVIAGAKTPLADLAVTVSVGHKLALSVTGTGSATRLTAQQDTGSGWSNISGMVNIDPSGTYIDGGSAGIAGQTAFGGDQSVRLDDWKGYDLP